jgi:drug/metabolite transporter (DMT)-like permease
VLGPLLAILSALGSSAKAIFIKLAYQQAEVDSVTLLALRMLFSAPVFLAVAWWTSRGQTPFSRRDWAQLAALGFLGFYLASFLDFWGLQHISVGLERLILYTYPALVVLFSALWLKRPIGSREAAALALAFTGIAIAFWNDLTPTASSRSLWLGSAAVFGASAAYAIYVIGIGQLVTRIQPLRLTGAVISLSTCFVLGHFFLTRPATALQQPLRIYWYALAMAMLSTVLPIFLTAEAIRLIGAARVSIIGFAGPVLTIFLGDYLLGEHMTALQWLGTALVISGVALASKGTDPDSARGLTPFSPPITPNQTPKNPKRKRLSVPAQPPSRSPQRAASARGLTPFSPPITPNQTPKTQSEKGCLSPLSRHQGRPSAPPAPSRRESLSQPPSHQHKTKLAIPHSRARHRVNPRRHPRRSQNRAGNRTGSIAERQRHQPAHQRRHRRQNHREARIARPPRRQLPKQHHQQSGNHQRPLLHAIHLIALLAQPHKAGQGHHHAHRQSEIVAAHNVRVTLLNARGASGFSPRSAASFAAKSCAGTIYGIGV